MLKGVKLGMKQEVRPFHELLPAAVGTQQGAHGQSGGVADTNTILCLIFSNQLNSLLQAITHSHKIFIHC